MRTIEQRLDRIERMLREHLRETPPRDPKRLSEGEVIKKYDVGRERLKQLRLGYKGAPPVLLKWGHIGGRRIDYDVQELNEYFTRTIPRID